MLHGVDGRADVVGIFVMNSGAVTVCDVIFSSLQGLCSAQPVQAERRDWKGTVTLLASFPIFVMCVESSRTPSCGLSSFPEPGHSCRMCV